MSRKDKTPKPKELKLTKNERLLYSTIYNLSVLVDTLTVEMLPQTRENKLTRLKASLNSDLAAVVKRMGIDEHPKPKPGPVTPKAPKAGEGKEEVDGKKD